MCGVFLFTLLISSNTISASTDLFNEEVSTDLFVDEDYILRDPITNKYSSDWSYLDTPENIQLQKEVQNYFLTMKMQTIDGQTSYEKELNKRIDDLLSLMDPEISTFISEGSKITPMSSYDLPKVDSVLVKLLEGRLHLAIGNLTVSNISAAIENSNAARDHGIRYAQNNNFYSNGNLITWDNTADTLRHFAWNYMNSNDFGVAKAKTAGDIHELALIALKYLNTDTAAAKVCNYQPDCMQTMAIQKTMKNNDLAKSNFDSFNNIFDNSSVMDLTNNAKGRLAYSQGNSSYSVPFNRMLSNGELITTPNNVFSSQRRTAWLGY